MLKVQYYRSGQMGAPVITHSFTPQPRNSPATLANISASLTQIYSNLSLYLPQKSSIQFIHQSSFPHFLRPHIDIPTKNNYMAVVLLNDFHFLALYR